MQLDDTSLAALLAAAEQAGRPLSELVLAEQAEELEQTPQQVYDRMAACYAVMAEGVAPGWTRCTTPSTMPGRGT